MPTREIVASQIFRSGVLPVLLQHQTIAGSTALIAQLLLSNKQLRAAVLEHCAGCLVLKREMHSVAQARLLGAWLARHGHLLHSLTISMERSLENAGTWSAVSAGLQRRAAVPPGLLLQELRAAQVPCSAAGVLLQQLPIEHLTCLRLHMYEYSNLDCEDFENDPFYRMIQSALGGTEESTYLACCGATCL